MSALIQQTEEWLEMRKTKIGASDAPIIMGVSTWTTPYQLWQYKLGIIDPPKKSKPQERGLDLEDMAREKFTEMTGIKVDKQVIFHPDIPWMMASLDGMDSNQQYIVEIKCPGHEDHSCAKNGKIPEKYYPQLQHQIEVCQLDKSYYFSFDEKCCVVLECPRNDKYIKKMVGEEEEFYNCMENFIPPPLTNRDYEEKEDEVWEMCATEWAEVQEKLEALEIREIYLRELLINLSGHRNSMGAGIRVCKTIRKGSVDYNRIPELKGVNLEMYRKDPIEYWSIGKIK